MRPKSIQATAALLLLMLSPASCGRDLELTPDSPAASEDSSSLIHTVAHEDGTLTTRVDASDYDNWVYFSFSTQSEVSGNEPAGPEDWDLGFQRYHIKANSGVSGAGTVGVLALRDADFFELAVAPDSGYQVDLESAESANQTVYAFSSDGDWFDYNPVEHTLHPRQVVYVVRASHGEFYKVQIQGYYSEAGDSGLMNFLWAPLAPPEALAEVSEHL